MTPGARVAAAIAVLDQINDGAAAEQALTAWARGSRYAGSKDRAAVRDHVFDVLRARRSLGEGTGRSLMQRLALRENWPLEALFSGEGHAPAPLSAEEATAIALELSLTDAAKCDLPDWLWVQWQDSLAGDAVPAAQMLQRRADVFLRVNLRRATIEGAVSQLATDDIATRPHDTVAGCLRVLTNPRRIKTATAYLDGIVELQDAASQFAIQAVQLKEGARVLDFCAGGGGKALGFADRGVHVFAHDIDARRMRDLPVRAARAGVDIVTLDTQELSARGPFDVVFCDAPCSGSGTWRRAPDAKWRLTSERLDALMQSQAEVLDAASLLTAEDGMLCYATCSVLKAENDTAIEQFIVRNPQWHCKERHQLIPSDNGDGFFFGFLEKS
jgi:16S rRNA (cytosine967-C5)-methyltransferase